MRTLLVANRGEIAVRIIRAARELGISTVAVCSEADRTAVHTRMADRHVVIGPAPAGRSYLDVDAVLEAALSSGADAVHPGYGFLSERAQFAASVEAAGLVFVGPTPDAIELMGDKSAARRTAQEAGVPVVPGWDGPMPDEASALAAAEQIGYPLVIKAAAGGGGRGIRVVDDAATLVATLPVARAEATAAFGNGDLYLERFVPMGRHVEVQVFGDGRRAVHLGERDCSVQRRRQKVIEEAPAPGLPDDVRADLHAAAVRLAEHVGYRGAGTVEFIYDPAAQRFQFMEMNTRIQVEHPVTEMVTGRDLISEQLTVAAGAGLSFRQEDVTIIGHAIEFRLTAEDPDVSFAPSPGPLSRFRMPGGPFVRVDSGYEEGGKVSPHYDSLLAKIVVWAPDRTAALARGRRALDEIEVEGVHTTAGFLRSFTDVPEFVAAAHHTTFVEDWAARAQASTAQAQASTARDSTAQDEAAAVR